MGVDGIGSGGGRPIRDVGASDAPGVRVASERSRDSEGTRAIGGPPGSPALDRLERGEIDLDHYLDARVEDAVRHLEGRVPAAHVDFVRKALREELATDPVLVELVRRTTGSLPNPHAE